MNRVFALGRTFSLGLLLLFINACALMPHGADGPYYVDRTSLSGAYLQGRFAAQVFDIPRAEEAFGEVARRWPSPEGSRTAFAYALAAGDMDEAERQARVLVAQGGNFGLDDDSILALGIQIDLPRLTLASAAMRDGDAERAVLLLEKPLDSSLGQSLGALLRSAAAYQARGVGPATTALTEQDAGTYRGLVPMHAGHLFLLEGDTSSAEAALRQALGAPRAEIAAISYGLLLEQTDRPNEANEIYRRMVQDAGLYTRAGRMGLVRTGALEPASRRFEARAKSMPQNVETPRQLYALALENFAWLGFEQAIGFQGDTPIAEERRLNALVVPLALANLARATDPSRDTAHYLAAIIYGAYDTPETAIAAADEVAPSSFLYEYAVLEKTDAMAALGNNDDAINALRAAIKTEPGSAQWALQLQIYLAAEGRYQEADVVAEDALEAAERLGVLPSASWRYWFARGAARIEAGRWPDGRDDLEKALELSEDEPIILNHLGYSYVERGEQLERAFGMIERALEIDPENGSIVDSLGWAHFQQGNYTDALEQLERAVELEPEDAVITDHLGDAYFMLGRERDARYEWERVLGLVDATDELKSLVSAKLVGDFSAFPTLASRDEAS